MKEEDPSFAAGREIGGYRIEHRLGEGGMGAVYAAVEPTIGRRVAIKVLRRELAGDKNHTARFEREARSVSALRHPTIIDIFSFGKLEDGRPFFVMPLLTGHSLREHLAKHGALGPAAAWQIAREVAAGLAAAHASGVLHRDLKPDNVFLAEYTGRPPQPMLLDFGLAKRIDAGADEIDPKDEMKLTATGVPIGTPIYMAPEQWWSAPSSPATDQYAFGVLLFESLTGRPPFNSQQFAQLLQQHIHEKPPALRDVGHEVGDDIEAFVARLLEKDGNDRFADFDDVIAAGDRAFGRLSEPKSEPAQIHSQHQGRAVIAGSKASVEAHAVTEPIAMSAVVSGDVPQRGSALGYAVTLALGLATVWLVGYAGSVRWDVRQWFMSIGWGAPLMAVTTLASIAALPSAARRARTRPGYGPLALGLALAPAALSLPSALTGWAKVTSVSEKLEPGRHFAILHAGFFEVGLSPFAGQAISSVLCLCLIVLLGAPAIRLRSPWVWAAAGISLVGVAALMTGVASAALVLLPTAGAILFLSAWTLTPTSLSRERALAGVSAVLCARGAAHSRAEAVGAAPWFEAETRAERVEQVVSAASERQLTLYAEIFAVLLIAVVALLVLMRARRAGLLAGETARQRLVLGAVQSAVVVAVLLPAVTFERDFGSRRKALGASLSEQFVLFARLDPPSFGSGALAKPVRAPALQITPETIALNGKGIGKLSALDTDTGRQAIANAIVTGLAAPISDLSLEAAADPVARKVDLALLVDRRVPWSRVEQVLALAFDGGARSADLLLTRGQEPNIPTDAPPEASLLLPSDFVALPLELGRDGLNPKRSLELAEVATQLLAQPGAGERSIAISIARDK